MRHPLLAAALAWVLSGCSVTPLVPPVSAPPLAGDYATVPGAWHSFSPWADGGPHAATEEGTLTLNADGTFRTGYRRYIDGQRVRGSVLSAYDLRFNSTGTWSVSSDRLTLRSTGPADGMTVIVMKERGVPFVPEQSEAHVTTRGGHPGIEWNGVDYLFMEKGLGP
jgi:hypothetical protein